MLALCTFSGCLCNAVILVSIFLMTNDVDSLFLYLFFHPYVFFIAMSVQIFNLLCTVCLLYSRALRVAFCVCVRACTCVCVCGRELLSLIFTLQRFLFSPFHYLNRAFWKTNIFKPLNNFVFILFEKGREKEAETDRISHCQKCLQQPRQVEPGIEN